MRLGSYLGQLLFRKSYFFGGGNLSRIKISMEEPLFGSRHLCTASTFQKSYFFNKVLLDGGIEMWHWTKIG